MFSACERVPDRLATLIAAAMRAPSADNTQPWRFTVDVDEGLIALDVDRARDPSPLNAGQRMARIAVGAALENIWHTALTNDWQVKLRDARGPHLAVVQLADPNGPGGVIDAAVTERTTNRRPYDARPVPGEVLARLRRDTPNLRGVRTCWLHGPERLAALIGQCDAALIGDTALRHAFLSKVRYGTGSSPVTEGLPLASLELSPAQQLALRWLGRWPRWLLQATGGLGCFAAHARRLVASAAGLCIVLADDERPETDIEVGRAAQRAWLRLTTEGLAAQPMMSLPGLEAALTYGVIDRPAPLSRQMLEWQKAFRLLTPEAESGRVAFLLRFGHAPAPSARASRRRSEEHVQWAGRQRYLFVRVFSHENSGMHGHGREERQGGRL